MAVLTMDIATAQLKRNTVVSVILPDPVRIGDTPLSARKVLWLLHGLSDDATSWLRLSRIEEYARRAGLVVVMPSGGRSMYCDGVLGQNYFTFLTQELPDYLSLVFGLSRKKEDNFIAGLSMGGYGAMKIALTYPERFQAVGSFSGLLDLEPASLVMTQELREEFPFLLACMDDFSHSPLNPPALLDPRRDRDLRIYVACGLQDDLLLTNTSFKLYTDELGIDVRYVFEDGAHEWDFWDRHIRRFLSFMLGEDDADA